MTNYGFRFLIPTGIALFAAWRLVHIWIGPAAPPSHPLPRPEDPAITASIPTATTFRWARPLFNRPADDSAIDGTQLSPDTPDGTPRLAGVLAEGDTRLAILELKGKFFRAEFGNSVGRWRVVAIGVRSITIESAGKDVVLNLDKNDY